MNGTTGINSDIPTSVEIKAILMTDKVAEKGEENGVVNYGLGKPEEFELLISSAEDNKVIAYQKGDKIAKGKQVGVRVVSETVATHRIKEAEEFKDRSVETEQVQSHDDMEK